MADNYEISYNTLTFKEYLDSIINYDCAIFGDIQANHSDGAHNTVSIKRKTLKDALLALFRSRAGVTPLANMVIQKYIKLTPDATKEEYYTVSDDPEISDTATLTYSNAIEKLDKDLPLDKEFHPQGEFHNNNTSDSPQL